MGGVSFEVWAVNEKSDFLSKGKTGKKPCSKTIYS